MPPCMAVSSFWCTGLLTGSVVQCMPEVLRVYYGGSGSRDSLPRAPGCVKIGSMHCKLHAGIGSLLTGLLMSRFCPVHWTLADKSLPPDMRLLVCERRPADAVEHAYTVKHYGISVFR
ncbi:hypothetical protein BaRGS_00029786 [Batillaria attramentaria]|uniref:Secreted protein n=1 Tax=Batillaria attramentaria TaxID=370345 RepID=A0ABD0JW17_9CAEN